MTSEATYTVTYPASLDAETLLDALLADDRALGPVTFADQERGGVVGATFTVEADSEQLTLDVAFAIAKRVVTGTPVYSLERVIDRAEPAAA